MNSAGCAFDPKPYEKRMWGCILALDVNPQGVVHLDADNSGYPVHYWKGVRIWYGEDEEARGLPSAEEAAEGLVLDFGKWAEKKVKPGSRIFVRAMPSVKMHREAGTFSPSILARFRAWVLETEI